VAILGDTVKYMRATKSITKFAVDIAAVTLDEIK
jgi:hypothetical protein